MNERVGMTERVYRRLLRLYPAAFTARFGDDMLQLFQDQLRDARSGGAPGGTVSAWLRMLGELVATAAAERLRRNRTMAHSLPVAPSIMNRALGAAGVISGVVLLLAYVVSIEGELNTLRIVAFNLGALAVTLAVYRRQARTHPIAALAGAVPVIAATAWYAAIIALDLVAESPFVGRFGLFSWSGMGLWIATAWFGGMALRIGSITRLGTLALTVGALLAAQASAISS